MNSQLQKKPTAITLAALMLVAIVCSLLINPFTSGSDVALETNYFKFFLCVTILVELVLFYYLFTNKGEIKYELVFPALLLAFGLIYLFAITPLSCPDEQHHYQSAYVLSNMILGQEPKLGNAADFDYTGYVLHNNVATAYLRIMRDFFSTRVVAETVEIPGPYSVAYILQHLPQGLGITLARLLKLNSLHVYQFGRLFNLILTTVCCHFAIKSTPRFKVLFGTVCLLPMAIQQASAYTYDCYVNAMTMLSVGLLFKAIWGKGKIKTWDLIIMLVINFIQAPAKTAYAFVALLVFFIPKERFAKPWMKYVYCSIYALACLGFSLKIYKTPGIIGKSNPIHDAFTSTTQRYSYGWILANPGAAFKVLLNTFIQKGPMYVKTCIGAALSGLSLRIPNIVVALFGLLAVFAIYVDNKGSKECLVKGGLRASCIGIPILIALLIIMTMFTGWTALGADTIDGVQGRYFLPIVSLFFIGFSSKKFVIKEEFSKFFIMGAGILQLVTIITIFTATIYK